MQIADRFSTVKWQVHTSTSEWLDKAMNFTSSHVVVECGGYGWVAVNSTSIGMGANETPCCFGRGGHVLYANSSELHLAEAHQVPLALLHRHAIAAACPDGLLQFLVAP